ncbi:hypothetical protein L1049_015279 [Liquidambar formosana]|uniref:BHLH domain-containing protein n=1 Tax=Liquidambar formosana TaxID=63359 RepID=A0AAP0RYZ9_LIQFO
MADNGGFEGDHLGGGSFSQLLFSDDDAVGFDVDQNCFNYSSSFYGANASSSKMLCFGNYQNGGEVVVCTEKTTRTGQKSGVTCSDSSSASSCNNTHINMLPKSNKKRNGSGQNSGEGSSAPAGAPGTSKKSKTENPTSAGPAKGKKEKLGDRIATLQQLVSPFGKTDTASVLHEATGYIRFLHEQVQVLCSPYLQRLPSSAHYLPELGEDGEGDSRRKDLKSRGLCLVPVACTVHVANSNGADFWSPAMADISSSTQL